MCTTVLLICIRRLHQQAVLPDRKEVETRDESTNSNGEKLQEDEVTVNGQAGNEAGSEPSTFPSLLSDDSGLGLSASTSEQQLPPGHQSSSPALGVCVKAEDVWRRGGSVENMSKCIQALLKGVITRYFIKNKK